VSDYGYLGGFYGASNEEMILKELRVRGPIILSFEPEEDFMYYCSGVYEKISYRDEDGGMNDEGMYSMGYSWEKVDHSVLLVGYGVEKSGEKFWKVQNSWGSDWGEDGYFRIKRGTDECSIESIAEIANPEILEHKHSE
jgi:cathepsin C